MVTISFEDEGPERVGPSWSPRSRAPQRGPTRLDPPLYRRAITRELEAVRLAPTEPDDERPPAWQPALVALGLGLALGIGWFVLVTLRPVPAVQPTSTRFDAVVAEALVADRVVAVTRWITTVSTTLLLGGAIFQLFVAAPYSPGDGPGRRTLRRAALVGIMVTAASLIPRSVAVSDVGLAAIGRLDAIGHVLQSRFGAAALLHITGLVVLASVAVPAQGGRGVAIERAACLGGGALVLGSYALTGHPRATSPVVPLVAAQLVHVVAVSTWFGGVAFLAIELRRLRRSGTVGELAGVVRRFSHTAMATVILAGTTGAALAASQLGSLAAVTGTPYGRALLAKLGALSVPLALGGYNARRLVPAIVRDEYRAWRRLRLTVAVEAVVLAVGVLLFTTVMTTGGI